MARSADSNPQDEYFDDEYAEDREIQVLNGGGLDRLGRGVMPVL